MAIYAVHGMFNKESTQVILTVDTSNAFNTINRKAFVHNTKILFPSILVYVKNCYSSPTDLYIQGGWSITSEEGTIQGDLTAIAIYALGITTLLEWLSKKSNEDNSVSASKQVAFVDDLISTGAVESLENGGHFLKKTETNLVIM